ncbi:MAG: glycosyltransferase family 2 protein [Candidatus Berkiella sp.]
MTYVIDLKRLWDDRSPLTASQRSVAAQVSLDPRQKVVSVIVAIQNEDMRFITTLQSALAQLMVRELIIVNCSQSPIVKEALAQFSTLPRTLVVDGEGIRGLASAYNLGVQYASTPFLLLLDAYCLLPKDAVLKLLATGVRKQKPWVVGATSVKDSQDLVPLPLIKKYFSNVTNNNVPEVSLVGGGHFAQVVPAQCILIPTPTFLVLKGLDKQCFHAAFHWDLCLRVHEMGGSVFQAKEIALVALEPEWGGFSALFKQEWRSFLGWSHFYQKNIRKLTNFISALSFYSYLAQLHCSSFCRKAIVQLSKRLPPVFAMVRNRGT